MKPGDKLWLVARNHRNHEITVAKIGRKWATTRRRWQVMSKNQRAATVPAFAEWLVAVARISKIKT